MFKKIQNFAESIKYIWKLKFFCSFNFILSKRTNFKYFGLFLCEVVKVEKYILKISADESHKWNQ